MFQYVATVHNFLEASEIILPIPCNFACYATCSMYVQKMRTKFLLSWVQHRYRKPRPRLFQEIRRFRKYLFPDKANMHDLSCTFHCMDFLTQEMSNFSGLNIDKLLVAVFILSLAATQVYT